MCSNEQECETYWIGDTCFHGMMNHVHGLCIWSLNNFNVWCKLVVAKFKLLIGFLTNMSPVYTFVILLFIIFLLIYFLFIMFSKIRSCRTYTKLVKKKKKKKLRELSPRDHQIAHITFLFSGSVDQKQILCSLSAIRSTEYPIRTQISIWFMFHLFFMDTSPIHIRRVSAVYWYPICIRYVIRTSSGVSG